MNKLIAFLIVFQSCQGIKDVTQKPPYTSNKSIESQLIDNKEVATGKAKNIIVYNVIEQEDEKHRISDETWRFLIGQFFTTITTILTIIAVEDTTQ